MVAGWQAKVEWVHAVSGVAHWQVQLMEGILKKANRSLV
jgi:hypothetical protein